MHCLNIALLLLFTMSSTAATQTEPPFGDALKAAAASAPLTTEESALAATLAEQALRPSGLWTITRMYLVDAAPLRDTAAEGRGTSERIARVTYYRYEGALTIRVTVNLSTRQVTDVQRLANFEPPFSAEEYAQARALVSADPQVKAALVQFHEGGVVEPITTRHDSPGDPLYRHRVINFFFRVGSRYLLRDRLILVDLTSQSVILQPISTISATMGER